MISIDLMRNQDGKIIFLGLHPGIIQSILDYDYLVEKSEPSIIAIIANGRKEERFFWGETEVILPVLKSLDALSNSSILECTMVVNVQSARRVLETTKAVIEKLPNLQAINIFAEQTPEKHAIELNEVCKNKNIIVAGPSSVGLLVPGFAKLGAIGGTQHQQLTTGGLLKPGDTAVISTSGGMVNELMHTVISTGHAISFAIALGGDLFPVTTLVEAFLLAESDQRTERIVYFGELGGSDEYELAELINKKQITKEVIAYIAGSVAELFETPPQFGHAKAMANTYNESASAKKQVLKDSGVIICDRFADLKEHLGPLPPQGGTSISEKHIGPRRKALFMSHISGVKNGNVQLLGRDLVDITQSQSLPSLVLSMILGQQVSSPKAVEFTDCVLKLLVDHGPQVSGAVNTIIAARAGKDLVSSLTAGLLTIGPRFGGAINEAASCWLYGVSEHLGGKQFVESYKTRGGIIPGIGHKKYRLDMPDPRVKSLLAFAGNSNGDLYLNFARSVESVTTTKKANLILNVDGAIAAIYLDILQSELQMTNKQLTELVNIEFFNALFIIGRSVGFVAHYLDQNRHDEGLFRLDDNDVFYES